MKIMDEIRLQNMKCHVLPGKAGPNFSDRSTYLTVYKWWKEYWIGLMQGLGSELPSLEEFFRQDFVVALMDEDAIVAMVTINQYNLDCAAIEHPYFEKYNERFHEFVKERKIENVYSGQWITVNPNYSARLTGRNFAAVILGLGHQVYRRFAHAKSALISVARADNPSANTAKRFGWETVGERFDLHNVACEQIALVGQPKAHANEEVNRLIEFYWERRREHDRGYGIVQHRESTSREQVLRFD